jgi:hypothetical protein
VPTPDTFVVTGAPVGSVEELVHQVGLPIPAEADPTGAKLATKIAEWTQLYGAGWVGNVPRDIYLEWQNLADAVLCLERDTSFGLATGDAPQVNHRDTGIGAGTHDLRTQRSDMDKLLRVLVDTNGVVVGKTWTEKERDRARVYVLIGGARNAAARQDPDEELISGGLSEYSGTVLMAPLNRTFPEINPYPNPKAANSELFATFTHETAHAIHLMDEYGGDKTITEAAKLDVRNNAWNLQVSDDTNTQGILWRNWPRIAASGLVIKDVNAPGVTFDVTLKHPHGRSFAVGEKVRLRERPFLAVRPLPPIPPPPPVIIPRLTYLPESNELEITAVAAPAPAGDVLTVKVVSGVPLNPANWKAGHATLFRPQGKPLVQAEVQSYLAGHGNTPLNRTVAVCEEDDAEIQKVLAVTLLQQLKRGKPKYKPWIHGLYDGGDEFHCGVFHASGACVMRALQVPLGSKEKAGAIYRFCHVCRYILVDELDPSLHGTLDRDYQDIYPEKKP